MQKLIFAITAALAVVGAVTYLGNQTESTPVRLFSATSEVDSAWTHWKQTTGRSYGTSTEETYRKSVFAQNFAKVNASNAANSFKMNLNKFADLTSAEFKAQYQNLKPSTRTRNPVKLPKATSASVDWRGVLATPVKDQGQCGSCWAFSTTGGAEGLYAKRNGSIQSFSEQQLVDCAGGQYMNQGCNGGLMDNAYDYVIDNGLVLESQYPYTARDGFCNVTASPTMSMSAYTDVGQSDSDLQNAVAIQPVSVAIDADPLQLYFGGIYNDWSCGTQLDHGVLVVGYGSENGQDYWLVKNSWGASWGESGYFRFARRSYGTGMCGITMQASYASS